MSCFVSEFGWIGQKIGMSTLFLEKKAMAVTLIKIFKQNVLLKKELENYSILKVGIESGKVKSKCQICEFKKNNQPLCKIVKEFKTTKEEANKVSNSYDINFIQEEKFVDITANTVGKGFAGGMKRWNFKGASASHGASLSHRSIGSTGTRDRMCKGKKMPGRLGNEQVTIQNLKVCYVDLELNVVAVHGAVPGKAGTFVTVKKAIKKQEKKDEN